MSLEHENFLEKNRTEIWALRRNQKGDRVWALQHIISGHRYEDRTRTTTKPDDPGWHACRCGEWEGYWSDYNHHVAEHQLKVLIAAGLIEEDSDGV